MQTLLAAITLLEDTAITAVDSSDFSDLSQWNVTHSGTIFTHTSTHFDFDSTTEPKITSPVFSPEINLDYGLNFKVSFTVVVTTASDVSIQAVAMLSGVGDVAYSALTTLSNGSQSVDIFFNSGAYTFDQIELRITAFPFPSSEYDFSAMSITGVDFDPFSEFNIGDRVLVYYDNTAEPTNTFVVYREDNPGAVLSSALDDGPNLGELITTQVTGINNETLKSVYRLCFQNTGDSDPTTGREFPFTYHSPGFPYISYSDTPDASFCDVAGGEPGAVVCDIHWTAQPVITETAQFGSTGTVQLAASSTLGTVKYTLDDGVIYSSLTNTSGLFTGLAEGVYTFFALDVSNCKISIDAAIPNDSENTYASKYYLRYKDIQNKVNSEVVIYERGFTADQSDVMAGAQPFTLTKNVIDINDKFQVSRATSAIFSLMSQYNFQYIGLFNQDERKYKIVFVHTSASYVGFIIPSVFNEEYLSPPYSTNVQATDNLATLSELDFLDASGNKILTSLNLITIISTILEKTGLGLNINSAVNIFEENMDSGAADDPLAQTYIDCSIFYNDEDIADKCDVVLDKILKPFGAFVIQQDSEWWIVEVNAQADGYAYRKFDSAGAYVSNGTLNPLKNIVSPSATMDVMFTDRNHSLMVMPGYGKIEINQALLAFESIYPLSLDLWQANVFGGLGVAWVTYPDDPDSVRRKFILCHFSSGDTTSNVFIYSPVFSINSLSDSVQVDFNYSCLYGPYVDSAYKDGPEWVRVTWQLFVTIDSVIYYWSEIFGWVSSGAAQKRINYIYTTDFLGEENVFSKKIDLPVTTNLNTNYDIQMLITFNSAHHEDFSTLTTLHDIPTVNMPIGTQIKGINSTDSKFHWYTLTAGTTAESSPDVVRPGDYNGSTNPVIWVKDTFDFGQDRSFRSVELIFLKSATVKFMPMGGAPQTENIQTRVNDISYKENLQTSLSVGSIPSAISNQHKLYRNIFRDADGEPLVRWTRSGIDELDEQTKILLKEYLNQYFKPSWKLSGNFLSDNLKPLTIIKSTVAAVTFSLSNEDFTGNLTGWTNSGSGTSWVYGSNSARVTFASSVSSLKLIRSATVTNLVAGIRIQVSFSLSRTLSVNERIDRLVCVLYNGTTIVQKVTLAEPIAGDTTITLPINFNLDAPCNNIGFFIEYVSGAGTCRYDMDYFRLSGITTVRYYTLGGFSRLDRESAYNCELHQLYLPTPNANPLIDDTGGGNTGGDQQIPGRDFSGGFSDGFS